MRLFNSPLPIAGAVTVLLVTGSVWLLNQTSAPVRAVATPIPTPIATQASPSVVSVPAPVALPTPDSWEAFRVTPPTTLRPRRVRHLSRKQQQAREEQEQERLANLPLTEEQQAAENERFSHLHSAFGEPLPTDPRAAAAASGSQEDPGAILDQATYLSRTVKTRAEEEAIIDALEEDKYKWALHDSLIGRINLIQGVARSRALVLP